MKVVRYSLPLALGGFAVALYHSLLQLGIVWASAAPCSQNVSCSTASLDLFGFLSILDPGCETCRDFSPHVKDLLESHAGKLRLVIRYAPFHQGSDIMVRILEATRQQAKYWETLQVMFDT